MTEQKPVNHEEQPKKTTNARPLKKIVVAIMLLFLVPITLLAILLISGSAQRQGIRLVDSALDSLSIEQVEGDLQQGLSLQNLRYQSAAVDIVLPKTILHFDLHCLWRLHLCIKEISLDSPSVQIDSANFSPSEPKQSDNKPLQRINLPVSVQLERFSVQNLNMNVDKHHIHLASFETALSLNNQTGLRLFPTQINQLKVNLHKENQPNAEDKIDKLEIESSAQSLKEEIDWDKLEQALTPALLANLESVTLPFDIHLNQIQGTDWQFSQSQNPQAPHLHIKNLSLDFEAKGERATLTQLLIESNLGTVQSEGGIQLSESFPVNFKTNIQVAEIKQKQKLWLPESQLQLTINGDLKGQTKLHLNLEGAAKGELQAEAYFNQAKTPFKMQLDAKAFRYPFDKKEERLIELSQTNLLLEGNLLDYRLALDSALEGVGLPKSKLDLQLKGQLQEAEIEKLQLDTLQGKATLQGKVAWRNKLQWNQNLQLQNLVLTGYTLQLPSRLSGELSTTGLINQEQWSVDIHKLDLQGSLSNKPLNLQAQLNAASGKNLGPLFVNVPNLDLNYGKNHLKASGKIGAESNFQMAINAPDLSGVLPELKANIQGAVALQGDIAQPNLTVQAKGQGIQYQQWRMNKFSLNGKVDVANLSEGKLDALLEGVSQEEVKFNQIKLSLAGNEQQHQLQFNMQGSPVAGKLQLSGSFDRHLQQWKGNLSQVQFQSALGNIQPNKNIALNYDHKNLQSQISDHCWLNPDVELCFTHPLSLGRNGDIAFNVKRFDLHLVNQLLDKELLKGKLQSEGKISWLAEQSPQATLWLRGDNLALAHKIDYRTFKLAIPKLAMNLDLANNNLSAKSEIQVENQGKLVANLDINDLTNQKALNGALQIQQLNLSLLNQLLTQSEQIKGNLNGNLKFAGKVDVPNVVGELNLNNINAVMKDLPFDIENGQLALRFKGNSSNLDGFIKTPDSQLNINGSASWQNIDKWDSRVSLQAEQFKVDIPNLAKLKLSPNIEIKANPKLLQLTGEINVPWARVEIESLPESAVSISKDEVILDGKTQKKLLKKLPAKTKSGMEVVSNLIINIQDDVRLDAYGLKTNLRGLLNVRQADGTLGLFGQINLLKGKYASFGQDLLIRKGIISFSGMPSQPMLDIEAIRNPESMERAGIVAGIRVVGLADHPTIRLFSEPSMSQDQALSYILTGRSLESSGESGGSVGAALLGLGLAKSGKLVGGIGEAFGIQDLNLGTQGVGEQSKVVVSGSITPRLQVKYSVGLFDGLAEFTVRYRLLPKLYVQSVSGITQAVDLLYQFEF